MRITLGAMVLILLGQPPVFAAAHDPQARNDARFVHTLYGSFDLRDQALPELVGVSPLGDSGARPRIVQFKGAITPPWREAVRAHGAVVRGYMPDNALLVVADAAQTAHLASLPFVAVVRDQPRLLRIDPRLVRVTSNGLRFLPDAEEQDVGIELSDANATASVRAAITHAGGTLLHATTPARALGKVIHARLKSALLNTLLARADVVAIEKYFPKKLLNDVSYGIIQAGKAYESPIWKRGIYGRGQIVGFADTGLAVRSCFFSGANKVARYEDWAGSADGDGYGHGTHVAGSIAGDNFGNGTYDTHDGMAPAAQLYTQDVATGPYLVGIPEDLSALFVAPYEAGVRIHTNSWGDDDSAYGIDARAVDGFVADHPDFLIFFAAGNAGSSDGTVGSPSTAKNVVAVGALDGASPEDMAYFSSHGPTADGRLKPTLSAPGVAVVSAKHTTACGVVAKSGTSMATPTAAGAAALVRQYFTDGFYPSGRPVAADAVQPSAALLKAVLIAGADNMRGYDVDGAFPSNGQGFGRINLAKALYFGDETPRLWVKDAPGIEQHENVTLASFEVDKAGPLKFVLTWSDPAGTLGALSALVNDLDLVVTGPGGIFRGNMLKEGASTLGDTSDKDNVEEVVYLPEAPAGVYTVQVRAANVPMGPQAFAVAGVGYFTPAL